MALAQSYPSPTYQNLTVLGTFAGNIGTGSLAAQAANTVVANVTAASASPTAVALPSCSTANSALKYTSASGFSCGTTYALTSGTLAQFAATTSAQLAGIVSDETGSGSLVFGTGPTIGTPAITGGSLNNATVGATTPSTGAFTTLSASSTVSGTGFSTYLASPPSIGGTAAAAGAFTTLNASGNDALLYSNTSGQSIPNNAGTTVTGWTKTYDRVNANFNAAGGTFTAPATAYYIVSVQIAFAAAATGAGNQYSVTIIANGAIVANGQYFAETATSLGRVVRATAVVSLTAGQTVVIQAYQASGGAVALSTTAAVNTLSIARLP
ncbi:hypothetical protein [Paraburkholderia unamae]|nr:hypothetical protein [Paraburkholderia unamae]